MAKVHFLIRTALFLGLFGCLSIRSYAQKEDINWICPGNIGIRFDSIPTFFPTDVFTTIASAISDSAGNIVFYPVGGEEVTKIPGIYNLGYANLYNDATGLVRNSDSLELYSLARDGFLVLRNPDINRPLYHILGLYTEPWSTKVNPTRNTFKDRLRYHIFDKSKNELIVKNKQIYGGNIVRRIHAVKHANGRDWWVVTHERDNSKKFLFFLLKDNELNLHHTQEIGSIYDPDHLDTIMSNTGNDYIGEGGFSHNGERYAVTTWSGIIDVFDFDRCSGMFSNWRYLGRKIRNIVGYCYYGSCLSPDGSKLYFHCACTKVTPDDPETGIWQIDLSTNPPTRYPVDTTFPLVSNWGSGRVAYRGSIEYSHHLKKILIGRSFLFVDTPGVKFIRYMSQISKPDLPVHQCEYDPAGFKFPKGVIQYGVSELPSITNYTLPPNSVTYHRQDTVFCEGRQFQLGIFPQVDTGYRHFKWHNHSHTLKDSGRVYIGSLDRSDTLIRTTHCSTADCLLRVDTFVVKVVNTNPPCNVARETLDIKAKVKIYPNPAKEVVLITANRHILMVRFYDLNGKKIKEDILSSSMQKFEADVKDLSPGIYLIRVETESGSVTQRVVVER